MTPLRLFLPLPLALLVVDRPAWAEGSPDPSSVEVRLAALEARRAEEARALREREAATRPAKIPFSFGDFSWAPANHGGDRPLGGGPFVGELRVDTAFHWSFARPKDHTITGSSEVFRHGELQITQLGLGGDFYWHGVTARVMTQLGMYSQTTPRNDASPARGQWSLGDAYRYVSEAWAGYHVDALWGVDVQAGLFMSYIGLWSYYNFDNWTYQPSFVSSNTPWFFQGARVQIFPTEKLKIEPWLVNGWQSYGVFNEAPGVGVQVLYRPVEWLSVLGNQYYGTDTLGLPDRRRVHTDDSVMVRLHDRPSSVFSRSAASFTFDAGCEWGGGATCASQRFLGFMAYARLWFLRNHLAVTAGAGAIDNPGRYLVLVPPVNGATAASGTSAFPAQPGDRFRAWDAQLTFDVMPDDHATFRVEYTHRAASVPYFAGRGGVTPPGGNQGAPGSDVAGWSPDLRRTEDRMTLAFMVKL